MDFSKNELICLNNCVNECLNGIHINDDEFKTRIGISKEKTKLLLEKISNGIDGFNFAINLIKNNISKREN